MKAKVRVNVVNVVQRFFARGARELPNRTLRIQTTGWGYPRGFTWGYPQKFSGINLGISHKILGLAWGYPRTNHKMLGSPRNTPGGPVHTSPVRVYGDRDHHSGIASEH